MCAVAGMTFTFSEFSILFSRLLLIFVWVPGEGGGWTAAAWILLADVKAETDVPAHLRCCVAVIELQALWDGERLCGGAYPSSPRASMGCSIVPFSTPTL